MTPEEAIDAGHYIIEHIVSLFEGPVAAMLLGADPLADIRNTTKIVGVMRNGRFHDRDGLDGLLAKVSADAPAR